MSKRRSTLHERCPRCRINHKLCFCEAIPSLHPQTRVSILMHKGERYLTSNTAHLAQLVLTNCQVFVRGEKDNPLPLEKILAGSGTPLYLFPDEEAHLLEATPEFVQKFPPPYHLIVPDGSWRQANKMKKREPLLAALPSLKLPEGPNSRYQVRKTPREDGVCTFEAIARALGVLENSSTQASMEKVLHLMVERILKSRFEYNL